MLAAVLGAACSRAPLAPNPGAASGFGAHGTYEAIDLGTLGGDWTVPRAISDAGLIVGKSANRSNRSRAFIYQNGIIGELAGTPSQNSADAINDAGEIMGVEGEYGVGGMLVWAHARATARQVSTGSFPLPDRVIGIDDRGTALVSLNEGSHVSRAKLWRGDAFEDLGGLQPNSTWTIATTWNRRGQVVGSSRVRTFEAWEIFHPFIWEQGRMRALPVSFTCPPTEDYSSGEANDVNDAGVVVGTVANCRGETRAVIWRNGTSQDLGAYRGRPTQGLLINNEGLVVARLASAPYHVFVWTEESVQEIAGLGGGFIWPRALNERGEIVGVAETAAGENHAFVWQNGVLTDLGPGEAIAINAEGDVIGTNGARGILWRKSRRMRTMVIQPPPPADIP